MPWPRVVSDAQSTLRSAAVCTPHAYPFGPAKTAAIGRVLSSSRKPSRKTKTVARAPHSFAWPADRAASRIFNAAFDTDSRVSSAKNHTKGVEGRVRGLLKTFVLVVGTGGRRFIRPTRQTSRGSPASLSRAIRPLLDALAAADAG
jgi:hypothetical protein